MIDLSTKSNRHRLVMFTNLAIIWGAHLAWRCEKNNTVSWSHVGKKTCVNSSVHEFEILYMEVVKLAVPRNHPSHGRPWPRLSIETTMVTWKFPLEIPLFQKTSISYQWIIQSSNTWPGANTSHSCQKEQICKETNSAQVVTNMFCMCAVYVCILYIYT